MAIASAFLISPSLSAEQSYQPPPGDPYTGNAAYQGPYAQQGYGQPAYPQTEYGQQQSHCQQPIYGQPPMSNAYGSPQQGGYYVSLLPQQPRHRME